MRKCLALGLFIIYIVISISCFHKNKQLPSLVLPGKEAVKKISIRFVDELDFRKSYADAQFMNNEKEIARYYEDQKKSNPLLVLGYGQNETLRKRFEELGIVKNEELLLHKFKYHKRNNFQYTSVSKKKLNIRFRRTLEKIYETNLFVATDHDSSEIAVHGFLQNFKYAFLDIIPGGNKELVVMNEYYIMNGDNFDLTIYEIIER
jgi:hypothetical protein